MTNILKSIAVLGIVAAVGLTVANSGAWFTDQEQVLGNSISTGTIDIALDGENPVSVGRTYALTDLKPSQHGYITEVVQNVGSNPANIFKTTNGFNETEYVSSEPKCVALDGVWNNANKTCLTVAGGPVITPTDLASHIQYDLRVELYNTAEPPKNTDKPVWWERIYTDSDNITLGSTIDRVYLGMVPAGWYLKVLQSYHMIDGDTPGDTTHDNKYQGEKLAFNMTFDAEQLKNTIPLENKYEANGAEPHHLWNDNVSGSLGYTVRDLAFNYEITSAGISGDYTLIAWDNSQNANPYSWVWSDSAEAIVLAHVTGGTPASGSIDINRNLINAKFWLVPGTLGTLGQAYGSVLPWEPTTTLFDTGLGDYYDANL